MNATDQHPLVAAYLDAVARETAELPAERRAELLADLREHIEVSGADGDDQVRAVLAELGEPRTVAASALAEEAPAGSASPAAPGRTKPITVLLGISGLLFVFAPYVGAVVLIVVLALLWASPQWDRRHRRIGALTALAVPALVVLGSLLGASSRIGPTELLLFIAFSLVVPVFGAVLLRRAVRR
ncbi:hypothetical protein [Streptomyces sp. NBC_00572]|uniref:HAAS signaling domain-containing protein n=1 Tax=Streptomyces sp. NBC_00572 TaxID=2903664 RepID=UPI0022597260|nr:hypothetical protein [Streptomyces sp. NBC_00572]MCX4985652.1 hypothetical protein [Streptomyces sp. NBC_00572]